MRVLASHRPLIFAALLVVAACRKQPAPTVFVDPALATLVPVDTVFIAGIRVEQLQATPVYERFATGKLPVIETFSHDTGIDLRRNLWEVVIPSDGTRTWVMLRGKFAEMGMEPRVNREGAQRLGYKRYTMLGDERMAVLFLNPTTAVAASAEGLRRIIDNRDAGTGIPARLQSQINNIPSTNQAWFAGVLPEIGQIAGGLDFRSGGDVRLTADAKTASEAQRFAQKLTRLFEGVQSDDRNVKLDVPIRRLEDLMELLSP